MKHLFDEPSEVRKIHKTRTPNLGGVAIFASMMFMSCIFFSFFSVPHLNYIIFSILSLFILGLTDDLVGVDSTKKMIAQFGIGFIVAFLADYRFTNFHGLFGIYQLPYLVSLFLTVTFIIFLINAFNLIDGINCLAGSIGFLACLVFAFYFWKINHPPWMYVSIAMCGCLTGFLFFNRTPAKIFMGDTGSTFLGLIIAILSINFIELNKPGSGISFLPMFQSAPALVLSLLIIPVFDTFRVFSIRIINKKSPFKADRNHIHHRLIDLKLTHLQATGILVIISIISWVSISLLSSLKIEFLLFLNILYAIVLNSILSFLHSKKASHSTRKMHNKLPPPIGSKHTFSLQKESSVLK